MAYDTQAVGYARSSRDNVPDADRSYSDGKTPPVQTHMLTIIQKARDQIERLSGLVGVLEALDARLHGHIATNVGVKSLKPEKPPGALHSLHDAQVEIDDLLERLATVQQSLTSIA